jgi:GT2 family glycosyltransferase
MYAEDAEWCERLGQVGEIWYLPDREIVHVFGASSAGHQVSIRWLDAAFAYFGRRHGGLRLKLFKLVCLCGFLLRTLLYGAGGLLRPDLRAQARSMGVYTLQPDRSLIGHN